MISSSRLPSTQYLYSRLELLLWPDLTVRIKELKCFLISANTPNTNPGTDFQPDRPIGYGAFGVVWSVTDPRDGKRVALKKLPNVFQSLVSSKRVFRELKMMRFFQHENVLSCLDILQVGRSYLPYEDMTLWLCDSVTQCWCEREGGALAGAGTGDIELEYRLSP